MNKNTALTALVTVGCFVIIYNYDFQDHINKKVNKFDFKFEDFSIYNISKKNIDLNIKSKDGTISKNNIELNNSYIAFRVKENNQTHKIISKNMTMKHNNIFFNKGIIYTSNNIKVSTNSMQFDIKKQILKTKKSYATINNNKIKSSSLEFKLKNNIIIAKDVDFIRDDIKK